ncbi:MAG: hypothetical protein J5476_02205 [Lachnospiraceae bacterium]|nr:hypothetical protein [Lachnospiraceae bacterium]
MKTKNNKISGIICIAILGLLPVLSVLIRNIISPAPVSLITSQWNDELFYFKQVESIIDYGYPRGFYGFNESKALSLSFAAWSPVLVWPWVLFGFIFGWTLENVFIYNLLIYIIAMISFGALVKPGFKQTAVISVWFLSFFLNARYIYSSMPEVICFSHLIIYWALMISYLRGGKKSEVGGAIVLAILMTFMRPYLILFLLFSLIVMIATARRERKFIDVILAIMAFGLTGFVYYLINHFLSAEYLMPFFYTDFITTFFTDGIGAGIHHLFGTLYYKGRDFLGFMKAAFISDSAPGIFFWIFLIMMLLQFIMSVDDIRRIFRKKAKAEDKTEADAKETEVKPEEKKVDASKEMEAVVEAIADAKAPELAKADSSETKTDEPAKESVYSEFLCGLYMVFADFAFLMAILLMYKLTEGSKHLLTFIMAGVLVMILDKKKGLICGLIMSLVVIYFGVFHCVGNDYDFGIPVKTAATEADYMYWEKAFKEGIVLDLSDVPSYKNSIIWEFRDDVDGEYVTTEWQMLYALPSGTGISCCMDINGGSSYTEKNFYRLRCRYIAVPTGGRVDEMCREAGYEVIGRDDNLIVYARY